MDKCVHCGFDYLGQLAVASLTPTMPWLKWRVGVCFSYLHTCCYVPVGSYKNAYFGSSLPSCPGRLVFVFQLFGVFFPLTNWLLRNLDRKKKNYVLVKELRNNALSKFISFLVFVFETRFFLFNVWKNVNWEECVKDKRLMIFEFCSWLWYRWTDARVFLMTKKHGLWRTEIFSMMCTHSHIEIYRIIVTFLWTYKHAAMRVDCLTGVLLAEYKFYEREVCCLTVVFWLTVNFMKRLYSTSVCNCAVLINCKL